MALDRLPDLFARRFYAKFHFFLFQLFLTCSRLSWPAQRQLSDSRQYTNYWLKRTTENHKRSKCDLCFCHPLPWFSPECGAEESNLITNWNYLIRISKSSRRIKCKSPIEITEHLNQLSLLIIVLGIKRHLCQLFSGCPIVNNTHIDDPLRRWLK